MAWPLLTDRLSIAHLGEQDDAFVLELLTDPDFLRYIGDRQVRSLEDARRYVREGPVASYRDHGHGLNRVAMRNGDRPIGICGILSREGLADPDLGFAFLPAWRGQGLALEAARAVMDHARGSLGLARILAITSQDNDASIRLLDRLGFRFQGLTRLADGQPEVRLFANDPD